MNRLEAVLLDVDGTLAETERYGHLPAFNRAFAHFGLEWQWSADLYGVLLAVTGSTERTRHYVRSFQAEYQQVNPDLEKLLAELISYKNQQYLDIVNSGVIPLRPGVERALREIHQSDVRMAIVTTTGEQNVSSLLENTIGGDVMDWFDVIAAGNIVENKKPAPDIYHVALEKLGLEPGACIAVEDSENGVRSAIQADVPVLVIKGEYTINQDLSGACLVVDEWGDDGQPFNVVEGNSYGYSRVELALLQRLVMEQGKVTREHGK